MKVSIEGILGSARKINSQRTVEEDKQKKQPQKSKTDSVAISNKINNRLHSIENDFRKLQNSITKHQVLQDGIRQLQDDLSKGGENMSNIVSSVRFEEADVLKEFIGENVTKETLSTKEQDIQSTIQSDLTEVKRLQVELDNLLASNLVEPDKMQNFLNNVSDIFGGETIQSVEQITTLQPDAVLKLVQ